MVKAADSLADTTYGFNLPEITWRHGAAREPDMVNVRLSITADATVWLT